MRWVLGALVLLLPVSALAQQGTLDTGRVVALASQVENAYATSPTEADFTETELPAHANGPRIWSGHATFTDAGFVLKYTTPGSRLVVSNLQLTRTIDTVTHAVTEERADRSRYALLLVLTGTGQPPLRTCRDLLSNGSLYQCATADGAALFIDGRTARVGRLNNGFHPDISFTNVRAIPRTRALPIVNAALLVK